MAFKMRGFSPFTKQGETFDQAFRGAKNAGVRYFYWKDKKYTTRLKEEDPNEKTYDNKKKYADRNKTWGEKKETKSLDYVPQSQRKKKKDTKKKDTKSDYIPQSQRK